MEEINQIKTVRTKDQVHKLMLLHQMMRARRFEEACAEMYTKTKIRGFLHLYIGQEAVATGVMQALKPEDNVISNYRDHGHALTRGFDINKLMAEMYGKKEGYCLGRGGSMHLFSVALKFYGGNAIVGGQLPIATGLALGSKKLKKNNITCCFLGEGAMLEGSFHESMNLAALWQVPLLFVCENNLYAMGTAIRFAHANTDLEKKALAYGIEAATVNGMDVLEVEKAALLAAEKVRNTGKPYFLIANTYRFKAHSMFDAELYRDKKEVEEWKKKDPITALRQILLSEDDSLEPEFSHLAQEVEEEINNALAFAEAGNWEPKDEILRFVYSKE